MADAAFLLHHTGEGRVGLCHADDGHGLADNAILARLTFDQTVGLYDDIHETFESCVARGQHAHPDTGDDEERHDHQP